MLATVRSARWADRIMSAGLVVAAGGLAALGGVWQFAGSNFIIAFAYIFIGVALVPKLRAVLVATFRIKFSMYWSTMSLVTFFLCGAALRTELAVQSLTEPDKPLRSEVMMPWHMQMAYTLQSIAVITLAFALWFEFLRPLLRVRQDLYAALELPVPADDAATSPQPSQDAPDSANLGSRSAPYTATTTATLGPGGPVVVIDNVTSARSESSTSRPIAQHRIIEK